MSKPSLRVRLRYRFDNLMGRGNGAVIALLGLVSLLWVLVFGFITWHWKLQPEGASHRWIETTWRMLTFTLDPGTFASDTNWKWRIPSLLTTIFGIFVVATLIGVIASGFEDRIATLRKGRSAVLETNHTVILGWNAKVFAIISELVVASESEHKPVIVVLANRDRVDMEREIKEKVPRLRNTKVVCRSGSPLDQDEVLRANPFEARSIIVLGDEDAVAVDAETIKTTLALTNHPDRPASAIQIVGAIRRPGNLSIAQLVGKHEAEWIVPIEAISKLTVQTCRHPGLSSVYSELLQFEGDEFYVTQPQGLVGLSHFECQMLFPTATVVGIIGAVGVLLNPPRDRIFAAGERLIVIAKDASAIDISPHPGAPDGNHVTGLNEVESAVESILILGSHSQLPLILSELNEYAAPGTPVTIVSAFPVPAFAGDLGLAIEVHSGDTADAALLASLHPETYDHILVLAYRDDLDADTADNYTLVTLLNLRQLASAASSEFTIVSEMLHDGNRRLAEVARVDDFIVSDHFVSLMMAQISQNPALNDVYNTLFSSAGAEIYLRPARWYVQLGVPVTFYSVAEGAARRGETAIGYRDLTPVVGDSRMTPRLNPAKTAQHVFNEGDLIIVLAGS